MYQVYSSIEKRKLLHTIIRRKDFNNINNRLDVSDSNEYLQLAMIKQNELKKYPGHYHLENIKETKITQESWVVIQGSVLVKLYDLDNKLLYQTNLYPGDASITFYGGHSYEILSNDTLIYEFKTGPYFGRDKDKELINKEDKDNINYEFINLNLDKK